MTTFCYQAVFYSFDSIKDQWTEKKSNDQRNFRKIFQTIVKLIRNILGLEPITSQIVSLLNGNDQSEILIQNFISIVRI